MANIRPKPKQFLIFWALLNSHTHTGLGYVKKNLATNISHRIKGTVPRDFRPLVFFMNQFPPKPLSIPLGPFRFFSKIRGDIRSSG